MELDAYRPRIIVIRDDRLRIARLSVDDVLLAGLRGSDEAGRGLRETRAGEVISFAAVLAVMTRVIELDCRDDARVRR
jgi:hypothetical protein